MNSDYRDVPGAVVITAPDSKAARKQAPAGTFAVVRAERLIYLAFAEQRDFDRWVSTRGKCLTRWR